MDERLQGRDPALPRCATPACAGIPELRGGGSCGEIVTGRWAGTNRVQVMMEGGSYAQVESSTHSAEDINPGDQVSVEVDADGRPVDWAPYEG